MKPTNIVQAWRILKRIVFPSKKTHTFRVISWSRDQTRERDDLYDCDGDVSTCYWQVMLVASERAKAENMFVASVTLLKSDELKRILSNGDKAAKFLDQRDDQS